MNRLWWVLSLVAVGCPQTDPTDPGTTTDTETTDTPGDTATSTDTGGGTPTDTGTGAPTEYCATVIQTGSSSGFLQSAFERFDAQGRLVEQQTDQLDDGDVDNITTFEHLDGRKVTNVAFDSDGDGTLNALSYTLSSTFQHEITVEYTLDIDGDGAFEIELTSTKSTPEGDPLVQQYDGGTGSVLTYVHTYDSERRPLTSEIDFESDGMVDDEKTYTYDDVTNVMTVLDAVDNGTSGYLREITTDASGRPLLDRVDNAANGSWDTIATFTYVDDRLTQVVTEVPSASYVATTTHAYDASGRRSSTSYQDTSGSMYERVSTFIDCP